MLQGPCHRCIGNNSMDHGERFKVCSTGNPPDAQGKLSLVALLKRYARVEVAAQADIQPPVTNQTPLMHLYGRHPRRPSS
ncbi:hypothetical protein L2E82_09683 [Cichorium intybus]|uniref:Uncharacterized protein n=3 Tax=Cichorium intybus TaxID=13427 RepID=A0ACB9E089_CICIN|nr:hypothetical protein L2E82_23372 [Cichorium intybus]KAI3752227.1 hypothetical protein L2E82_23841 [Cichorium intybus]KAI3779946.1 hypothetical protein L2E82_09683 [Cichorium intybus]